MTKLISRLNKGVMISLLLITHAVYAQIKTISNIQAVNINFHFEYFGINNKFETSERSFFLINASQHRIFMDPFTKYSVYDTLINHKKVELSKVVGTGYDYLVGNINSNYGLSFRSLDSPKSRGIVLIDSIINEVLKTPSFLYPRRDSVKNRIEVNYNQKTGVLIEKLTNNLPRKNSPDTVYFYFQKEPLRISFYNKSLKGLNMYLFKTVAIFNAQKYDPTTKTPLLPRREWRFTIQNSIIPDSVKIRKLIDKFINETSLNK